MTFWKKAWKNKPRKHALPIFSVDLFAEAEGLQILLCKRTMDGRYIYPMPPDMTELNATKSLDAISAVFEKHYRILQGETGA